MIRVTEIFASIQGEGLRQGKPCLFIRLSGCNLRCVWCDTLYSADKNSGETLSIESILQSVENAGISYISITGGEPLLQKSELLPLVKKLYENGFTVDIETNGTISFEEFSEFAAINMDVKTPSSGEESDLSLIADLKIGDSLKFVIGSEEDYRFMKNVLEEREVLVEVCVTPVYGSDVLSWLVEKIIEDRLLVRFQVQLHKVIGVA